MHPRCTPEILTSCKGWYVYLMVEYGELLYRWGNSRITLFNKATTQNKTRIERNANWIWWFIIWWDLINDTCMTHVWNCQSLGNKVTLKLNLRSYQPMCNQPLNDIGVKCLVIKPFQNDLIIDPDSHSLSYRWLWSIEDKLLFKQIILMKVTWS